MEWHPTKGLLVSGSKDNMMKFWDPRTGNCISTLYVYRTNLSSVVSVFIHLRSHYHKNTIQALAWSPNGNMVASASRDQTVRVFDIRAMREVQTLRGHKKEVCCVFCIPFRSLPNIQTQRLLFCSCHMASFPPNFGLRWIRRFDSSLGPFLIACPSIIAYTILTL